MRCAAAERTVVFERFALGRVFVLNRPVFFEKGFVISFAFEEKMIAGNASVHGLVLSTMLYFVNQTDKSLNNTLEDHYHLPAGAETGKYLDRGAFVIVLHEPDTCQRNRFCGDASPNWPQV